jgi:hypothetical protein
VIEVDGLDGPFTAWVLLADDDGQQLIVDVEGYGLLSVSRDELGAVRVYEPELDEAVAA